MRPGCVPFPRLGAENETETSVKMEGLDGTRGHSDGIRSADVLQGLRRDREESFGERSRQEQLALNALRLGSNYILINHNIIKPLNLQVCAVCT